VAAYRLPQYAGPRLGAVASLLVAMQPAGAAMTYVLQGAFTVRSALRRAASTRPQGQGDVRAPCPTALRRAAASAWTALPLA
jgi:hypothetical protein